MEAKRTPERWEYTGTVEWVGGQVNQYGFHIVDQDGELRAHVYGHSPMDNANAHQSAAGPDLLAAAIYAWDVLDCKKVIHELNQREQKAHTGLAAAIAKARGEA